MFFLNRIGIAPSDDSEIILKKNFVVYLGASMSAGALIWAALLIFFGLPWHALVPLSYVVITLVNFSSFHKSRHVSNAGFIQGSISICLPFLMQWLLGGFNASGIVMLWSVIALLGTITFASFRLSAFWFFFFVLLILVSWQFEYLNVKSVHIPIEVSRVLLIVNLTLVCTAVFWLSVLFVYKWRQSHDELRKANEALEQSSELLRISENEINGLMQTLKSSERKYRELVENSTDIVYEADENGQIIYANKAAMLFTGLNESQLNGRSFLEFIPESTRDEVTKFYINQVKCQIGYTQRDVLAKNNRGNAVWINQAVQMHFVDGRMVRSSVFARDINQLKEVQERLTTSEKQYRDLVENANDIIFECDGSGIITYVNPAAIAFTELSESEILGKNFGHFAHPDNSTQIANHFLSQAKENRVADRLEACMITSKGKSAWLDVSVRMVFEAGWMIKSYVIARDISELVSTREKLKEREGNYRLIFENSTDLIMQVALDGTLKFVSPSVKHLTGYDVKEVLGMRPKDFIHPDDMNLVNEAKESIIKTGLGVFVARVRKIDGSYFWMEIYSKAVFQDGNFLFFQNTGRNISRLVEARNRLEERERHYRLISENTHDLITQTSQEGVVTYASPSSINLLGYTPEEIVGGNVANCIFVEDRVKWEREREEILKIGYGNLQVRLVRKDGSYIWVDSSLNVVNDEFGAFQCLQSVSRDITQKRAMETRIEEALKKAETANRAKSDFLANVSHEMRTPLNGITGFTNLLLESNLDSTQRQYMDIVEKSSNNLLDLINDLLDFSKIEAGKMDILLEPIDLFDVGAHALDVIRPQADKKNIEVIISTSPLLPRKVMADGMRLKQVLVNLLSNAVKFTEEGEIELKIEIMKSDPDKNTQCLRFSVHDTGIGISSENQKRIFEAFQQAESYISKKYGGTGLGLSISNKLLDLMGSKLQLSSSIGRGSVFYFDLTVKSASAIREAIPKSVEPVAGKTWSYPINVLLVEDNPINRSLAKILISKILPHSNLLEATHGAEALDSFVKHSPELVFMDIQMPVMDGLEATRRIRAHEAVEHKSQPTFIIALTAGTVVGEEQRCISAGMNRFVSKPIQKEALLNALTDWANGYNPVSLKNVF